MRRLQYLLIGNSENRRIRLFQEELAEQGHPQAIEVSYLELLSDPGRLSDLANESMVVRQDSAGENFALEKRLLALGYADARTLGASTIDPDALRGLEYEPGRILCPRQQHLGFLKVLEQLQNAYDQHDAWRILSPTSSVALLFDKRETSKRWQDLGLAVPERIEGISCYEGLREAAANLAGGMYIKVSCSSSASCLGIYQSGAGREMLTTTVEHTPEHWYNTRRIRRYTDRKRIEEIVDFLLKEGAQVERSVRKARLQGQPFDLRVVCIAGEPEFTVVRQSRHVITNLHLGGRRGDLAELEAAMPERARARLYDSCRRIAQDCACFALGIDVLVEPGFANHRIIEANAFGDLLPNLMRDGDSVYGLQIKRIALGDD